MIAAGLSNPQLVRLVRRRRFGLPLASGLMRILHVLGHLDTAVDPSGRALATRMPPAVVLLDMIASLHVEGV